jgi:hypothetical protein
MTASFPKTQFPPVVYAPPENLPACRPAGPTALADRRPAPRPAVVQLKPMAGATGADCGCAARYTVRLEAVGGADVCIGRLIDVYV